MKLKTFAFLSAAVLLTAACSEKEHLPTVTDIAGSYQGYTLASCAYFQNTCTANENVTVAANADGTAKVTFTSDAWGEFTIPNAQMKVSDGTFTLSGNGQTQMGMGGNVAPYDCTYSAVIHGDNQAQMQFKVAGVMGGLTLDFKTGEAPAELLLAGTYKGYTDADCAYFQNRYTDNESLKVTANEDGTAGITYESATWGLFQVEKATLTGSDGEYTLSGSGKVEMGMGGSTQQYDFTLTGTCNAAKDAYSFTFSLPAVMGGLTITLLPGTAPGGNE